jgi:rubrerythrin
MKEIKDIKEKIKKLEKKLEALVIAIPKEEASLHFYQDLASSYEEDSSKEMFLELAQQEIEHKKKLEAMTKELQESIGKLKAEKDRLANK